jgi:hypothetical protein
MMEELKHSDWTLILSIIISASFLFSTMIVGLTLSKRVTRFLRRISK